MLHGSNREAHGHQHAYSKAGSTPIIATLSPSYVWEREGYGKAVRASEVQTAMIKHHCTHGRAIKDIGKRKNNQNEWTDAYAWKSVIT